MTKSAPLPNTVSTLFPITLQALDTCESNPLYRINMGLFHVYSDRTNMCSVGLAGAAYAYETGFAHDRSVPVVLPKELHWKLQLIEFVSRGMLDIVWAFLTPEADPVFILYSNCYKLLQDRDLYSNDPALFKQAIADFAELLKSLENDSARQKSRKTAEEVA